MKTKMSDSNHSKNIGGDLASRQASLPVMLRRWRQKLGYYTIFTAIPAILASNGQEAQAANQNNPELLPDGQSANLLQKIDRSFDKSDFQRRRSNYFLPYVKNKYNMFSPLAGGDNCPGNPITEGTYTTPAPYTDSGNTSGANNTVNALYSYYYDSYGAGGPDQIYSFRLTGRGTNPQIQVSATSASYNPMIYILEGIPGGEGCPGGTNNFVSNYRLLRYSNGPGGTIVIPSQEMSNLPLNVPLYLFVDSPSNGANSSGSYMLRIQDVTIAAVPKRIRFDFDGDGKADVSVFRPSDGYWYVLNSQLGFGRLQLGSASDKIVPGDYDGDGRTDYAFYRDGTWYLQRTILGYATYQFGETTDIVVPADYDADGQTDIAVYRPSTGIWHLRRSYLGFADVQFGAIGDIPMPGDFDGDGKTDVAVFRPSNGVWYILASTQGFYWVQFGREGDKLASADYDGDGKTDLAVFRPSTSTWYINRSQLGFASSQFGISTDIPVPADFDGDGKADIAVYRNDTWFIQRSTAGFTGIQFGSAGDKPIPSACLR